MGFKCAEMVVGVFDSKGDDRMSMMDKLYSKLFGDNLGVEWIPVCIKKELVMPKGYKNTWNAQSHE